MPPIFYCSNRFETLMKKENTKLTTSASPRHYNRQPTYTLHGQKIFYMLENWPSDSTSAEFWLKELYPKYYHRYLVIRDDDLIEYDWIEVDEKLYTPIDQGMVILKRGKGNEEVKAFYDFILSAEAKAILKQFGYRVE